MRAGGRFVRESAADVTSYDWLVPAGPSRARPPALQQLLRRVPSTRPERGARACAQGASFSEQMDGHPLSALYHFEHTKMPANAPDSLPDDKYITITAYILQQNGYAAGSEPLNRVIIGRTLPKP
jgi:hypothetical protein